MDMSLDAAKLRRFKRLASDLQDVRTPRAGVSGTIRAMRAVSFNSQGHAFCVAVQGY
jgi:hypothetical protein